MKLLDEIQEAYEKSTKTLWEADAPRYEADIWSLAITEEDSTIGYSHALKENDCKFVAKIHTAWPEIKERFETMQARIFKSSKDWLALNRELARTKAALEKCKEQRDCALSSSGDDWPWAHQIDDDNKELEAIVNPEVRGE